MPLDSCSDGSFDGSLADGPFDIDPENNKNKTSELGSILVVFRSIAIKQITLHLPK